MNFDNNDIQRNDVNALPPIGRLSTKRDRLIPVIMILCLLLLAAALLALILIPFYSMDPIANTAEFLFYDEDMLGALAGKAKNSGLAMQAELVLPANTAYGTVELETEWMMQEECGSLMLDLTGAGGIRIKLVYDETRIAVYGGTPEPLILYRDNAVAQLEKSDLNPDDRFSPYALSQQDYEMLKSAVSALQKSDDQDTPMQTVVDAIHKHADKRAAIDLNGQPPFFRRTVTYTLEGEQLQQVARVAAFACQKDETLNALVVEILATDEERARGTGGDTLLSRREDGFSDATLVLSYHIAGGKVTFFSFSLDDPTTASRTDLYELSFSLVDGKETVGFDLTIYEGQRSGATYAETTNIAYRAKSNEEAAEITLQTTLSNTKDEETTSTLTLHYDKQSGDVKIDYAPDDQLFTKHSGAEGTLTVDEATGELVLELTSLTVQGETVLEKAFLTVTVGPLEGKIPTVPSKK